MTEEKLVKILSELKSIKPKSDYSKKSRVLLLSSVKPEATPRFTTFRSVFDFLRVAAVTAFGIVLLLTIFGGVSYVNKNFSPILLPGLDQKSVITEADEINNSINVTLKEITYLDNSTAATNNQIDQIANNKKTLVTETVPTPTSTNSQYDQKINDLLEKASQ
ncbi:MAG: hypothetical protein AAB494_02440 [Patescibacteria group bacterium]